MPVTPFHFGPGLLLKGIFPKRVSWSAFAAAQVVIDCETLYHMVRHEHPVHRGLHTFVGATLAGLGAAALLVAAGRAMPALGERLGRSSAALRSEAADGAILAGGIAGGASHPFFDGLMHSDIRPFLPWTGANPLHGLVGSGTLHLGCLAAAVVGAILVMRKT